MCKVRYLLLREGLKLEIDYKSEIFFSEKPFLLNILCFWTLKDIFITRKFFILYSFIYLCMHKSLS